jgi:thiamine kinase-like enzyme
MTISFEPLEELLSRKVSSAEKVGGGRNSRVYHVRCEDSQDYIVKYYARIPSDKRDRLGTEFAAFRFLRENGISAVPAAIRMDRERGCAVYEYIDGIKINAAEAGEDDIEAAADFLEQLRQLSLRIPHQTFSPASEACFSAEILWNHIESRWQRFVKAIEAGNLKKEAAAFLTEEFIPFFEESKSRSRKELAALGVAVDKEIGPEEKTLSPSDFGFHNALKRGNGRKNQIVFVDFEYFGWDDPAKMISDFLLHPGQQLSEKAKEFFVEKILNRFPEREKLEKRAWIFYPFFGLKWTLILLNEFLNEEWQRRDFSHEGGKDRETLQQEQLEKAKKMFYSIKENHERFPGAR